MTTRRHWVIVGIGAIALTACGSSGDSGSNDSTPTTTAGSTADSETTTPDTTDAPPDTTQPPGATPSSFDEVQPAVIQIVAKGTIRDPEVGYATTAGSGSGFIISTDGLAVTNNHVVTGAATLEVYIGGDTSTSYNATIVGVSECNDLALIQIDSRDPLPTLSWHDGDPAVGLEVYAAGFPLGDPEFTLTRGIVAKARADGDTPWASIDSTIEHDANIQPGNSGGPLVAADGSVVGVNYASASATNQSQYFAIDSELAQEVVEELRDGDFESLGINGRAVVDEEAGIAGIWVSGVAPGSPASDSKILPGDIVTALNSLPVAGDGSYSDYCDVLRTSGSDKPIDIEVLRFDSSEILRGEINGDTPIEPVFSFAEQLEDDVQPSASGTGYTDYQTLVDDTGAITIAVPNEWADIDTTPLVLDDGTNAPWISASPSLVDLQQTYSVPGIIYTILGPIDDLDATLDGFAPSPGECATDGGSTDYNDPLFFGRYHVWSDCGGVGATLVSLVAIPGDGSYTAIISAQLTSEADLDALDQAFATFNVVGG